MEKLSSIAVQEATNTEIKEMLKKHIRIPYLNINKKLLFTIIISFIFGRAVLLENLFPFGIALYTALYQKDKKNLFIIPIILLGILSIGGIENILKYAIIMVSISAILFKIKENMKNTNYKIGLIGASIVFAVEIVMKAATETLLLFDVFIIGIETISVFVFINIFLNTMPILNTGVKRKILSNEELVCLAISVSIAVSGLGELMILDYRLKYILAILLTMVFAYEGGATVGGCVGITIGLVISMAEINTPLIIGILGLSGMLAGVFKDLGKLGSCLGMLSGTIILTFYINGFTEKHILITEIIISFVLFLLIPKNVENYLNRFINNVNIIDMEKTYGNRTRKIIYKQLHAYSQTLSNLANIYSKSYEKEEIVEEEDINNIVDMVASKVCSKCSMANNCWENNLYDTFKYIAEVIVMLKDCRDVDMIDIRREYGRKCLYVDKIVPTVVNVLDIYRSSYKWQKKLGENRELLAQQFEGISKTINELSCKVSRVEMYDQELENLIFIALDKRGILINDVTVIEKEDNSYEIDIEMKHSFNDDICIKEAEEIISKELKSEYKVITKDCYNSDDRFYTCTLAKNPTYRVAVGAAKLSKEDKQICGDSYGFTELPDNKYMMILSDGMGSGEKAAQESMMTVNILEQLIEAGFEKELALKTINSILLLKSTEEIFSTVDMVTINLNSGKAEFLKIGAAATFIKRKDNTIETIKIASLPIGILEKIKIEEENYKLEKGEYIIMLSDGIQDACEDNEWIKTLLKSIKSKNPQTIADIILNEAVKNYEDREKDDLTVLVARVF